MTVLRVLVTADMSSRVTVDANKPFLQSGEWGRILLILSEVESIWEIVKWFWREQTSGSLGLVISESTSVVGFRRTSVVGSGKTRMMGFGGTGMMEFRKTSVAGLRKTGIIGFIEISMTRFMETTMVGFREHG